jgi:hypothetical protein
MMVVHPEHSVTVEPHPHSASVVQVESGRLVPWLMFCSVLSGLAVGLGILAMVLGQQSEREARLAQYDLQILRAKVESAGIKTSDH